MPGLFSNLVGVDRIDEALLEPKFLLLLSDYVLDPCLLHMAFLELAEEDGVPEVGSDAKVLAASHQRVGFGAFDGGGEPLGVEVVVDALGFGNKSV